MREKLAKPSRTQIPTSGELRLMQVLWEIGEATVEDVVNAHPVRNRPNYKTTQTLLRIMEEKGFIKHSCRGRVFVFTPLVSRKAVGQRSLKALLAQNFGGSPAGLFLNLLEATPVKEKDLEELEFHIREYRKKNGLSARN